MFADSPFATEPFAGNYTVFTNGKIVEFDKTIVLGLENEFGFPATVVFNTNIKQAPTFFLRRSIIRETETQGPVITPTVPPSPLEPTPPTPPPTQPSSGKNKFVFTSQPIFGVQGQILAQVKVTVLNNANQVDTKYGDTIKITLTTGVFNTGKNFATVTATNGVAVFNGLIINEVGTYALVASAPTISSITSLPITIASPTEIVISIDWE